MPTSTMLPEWDYSAIQLFSLVGIYVSITIESLLFTRGANVSPLEGCKYKSSKLSCLSSQSSKERKSALKGTSTQFSARDFSEGVFRAHPDLKQSRYRFSWPSNRTLFLIWFTCLKIQSLNHFPTGFKNTV